jgi:hypothetical protein
MNWLFERINKIGKQTKTQRRSKLINLEMKGNVATIQRIIREYFENLYSNKLKNPE